MTTPDAGSRNLTADRTGRTLLALCAIATMAAFFGSLPRIGDAPTDYVLTEFWRTMAYLVFAGLWALLALAPRAQRGLFELILLHKVLVTVHALVFLDLPGAVLTAWIDGLVVAATGAAYVLCRGWTAWRR